MSTGKRTYECKRKGQAQAGLAGGATARERPAQTDEHEQKDIQAQAKGRKSTGRRDEHRREEGQKQETNTDRKT